MIFSGKAGMFTSTRASVDGGALVEPGQMHEYTSDARIAGEKNERQGLNLEMCNGSENLVLLQACGATWARAERRWIRRRTGDRN